MTASSSISNWRGRLHALSHRDLPDPLQRRLYPLLFYTLLALGIIDFIGLVVSFLTQVDSGWTVSQTLYVCIIAVSIIGLWLAHRGAFQAAAILITVGLLTIQILGLASIGLIGGAILLPAMMTALVLAGLMLHWRSATVISLIACALVGVIASNQIGSTTPIVSPGADLSGLVFSNAFVFACLVAFVLVIVCVFRRALQLELQESLAREADVRKVRDMLQTQVAEQTSELQNALNEQTAQSNQLAETLAALKQSEATVQQLHAPIIPVIAGVLLVPLVGALGRDRTESLASRVLGAIEQNTCRTLVFDLTSVAVMDEQDVAALLRIARAAQLMGVRIVIVGIGPEVVQHIVALELPIHLTTYATLEQAIAEILRRSVTLAVKQ